MENEIFDVTVDGTVYNIISPLIDHPDPADHQVWKDDKLLFIINPHLDTCEEPCWKLNDEYLNKDIDADLVSRIGEEIERCYL